MSGARPCWEALPWALKYFSCEGRKDINKVRGRGGGRGEKCLDGRTGRGEML